MVCQSQEETSSPRTSSWLWPLLRRSSSSEKKAFSETTDDSDRYLDAMEMGLARELVTDFTQPLRKASKLWKFRVQRSEDGVEHRLYSDNGEFLMYARSYPENSRVAFHLYDPLEKNGLYDSDRPAFVMSCNQAKTEWRLIQEKAENGGQYMPKHLSCGNPSKQEIATIRHSKVTVGDGMNYTMECAFPGAVSKAGAPKSQEAQQLITKLPVWNEEIEQLVLDFRGRRVLSSAKNFQLTTEEKPEHVVCQYGKIAPNTFGLDFRYPLSVVQAFGISMTTLCWV